MKTILITGIGGLTPRSIAGIIRENHPDYYLIGTDVNKRAVGFFMEGLLDEYYVCPRCKDDDYFPFVEKLVADKHIDYAFVQPESEIVEWGDYYEKNGRYPCPVFMGSKTLSVSLKDKSIMAELLEGTDFIPKTIKVTQENPRYEDVKKEIGFPCWIRATEGTGGLGSLKLENISSYKSWLFINSNIPEFTVSEFLTGRHLANEMLYYNGEYVKGAALECVKYVMANTAPSHVTGNTAFGRFLNEDRINKFCDDCIKYLEKKLGVPAHGILSFDLKEDKNGNIKVTEVNIRHMAYVGVMSHVGFDLVEDTIKIMEDGNADRVVRAPYFHYEKPYVFLRDVDVDPIILPSEEIFDNRISKSKQNILISSAGQRVRLVQIFQDTIKQLGMDVKVYASDMNPLLAPACHVADDSFAVSGCYEDHYIDELLSLCKEKNIGLIVPTIDPELMVFAANTKRFEDAGIYFVEPDLSYIRICRDKRLTAVYLPKIGIPVPKSIDKHHPVFPMFAKPYDGSRSVNTHAIMNQNELTKVIMEDPKLIFMEYVDKKEYREFTVDMYYGRDGRVKGIVPRERLKVREGEISKGITRKNYIVDFLKERMGYIEGVRGCICIQLFYRESDNDIKGIEINPRFGGGFPLTYYAKANFVEYLIREYLLGESIDYSDDWLDRTMMLRYDDDIIVNEA